MKPLVSILIPAYNAEETIAATIQSALAQTWTHKEIIVVDDGSLDRTAEIVSSFRSKITLVSTQNQGASAARNQAFRLCQGDYIQWLDADDLLALDKIERQLAEVEEDNNRRVLLSSPWARIYYRTNNSRLMLNSLCEDLSPVEWLLRKMSNNLHMQTATWLMSRELVDHAGEWDTSLTVDDDGEYTARVLLASDRTRFVPETTVYYRVKGRNRLSYIGNSDLKKDSLCRSIKLHIQYIRSLEESARVRDACMRYLRCWYPIFYPERSDLVAELKDIAAQLQGDLEEPRLRWKYAWIRPIMGWKVAKNAQNALPKLKEIAAMRRDEIAYKLENHNPGPERSDIISAVSAPLFELRARRRICERSQASSNSRRILPLPIPKRIIQTGKDANLPLKSQAMTSNVKLLNPDFEYLFFDDTRVEQFIDQEFPQYREMFHSFQFTIQKYDFFRYLAVYRYGGFYFDLDVLLGSSLEPLLEHSCVFPFEALTLSSFLRRNLHMDWQVGNYAFGASPGAPFLKAIIENCVRAQEDPNWIKPMMRGSPPLLTDEFTILNSTGPGLVSRTFAENPEFVSTVTILFPDNICDPENWNYFGKWGIHLMDSSWRRSKSFIHRKTADFAWRWIQSRNVTRSRNMRNSIP